MPSRKKRNAREVVQHKVSVLVERHIRKAPLNAPTEIQHLSGHQFDVDAVATNVETRLGVGYVLPSV